MHRGPIYPTFEQVEDSVRVYWHHESQACRDYTYENEDATGSGDAPVEYVVGPGSTALLEHAWPLGWVLGDPGLPDYAYRDLLLLELVDPTDEVREGLCFAGWDITDMDIEPVLGFHHPFAQSKKMSFEYTSISTWISRPPIRRGSDGAVRQHST
jgi:hypothetical protein